MLLSSFPADSLKAKMGISALEKSFLELVDLFHTYTGNDDKINKDNFLKMMEENFPNFLRACVSGWV